MTDPIRQDTANQYRKIRRLLKGDQTPDPDHYCTCSICELRNEERNLIDQGPTDTDKLFSAGVVITCIVLAAMMILVFWAGKAHAYTDDQAVKAIIGEAENQGLDGMIYVACGIVNRGSLHGVYGLHNPRVTQHKYSKEAYLEASTAWSLVHETDGWEYCKPLEGSSHWENTNAFGLPYWAKGMKVVFIYKDHKFFK